MHVSIHQRTHDHGGQRDVRIRWERGGRGVGEGWEREKNNCGDRRDACKICFII